ncbi:MAG: type II toxin-antitoxin system VapC family toxin [Acidimicrobiales bacterium]
MFVLDTNVVSDLRKVRSGRANPGVAGWAEQVPSVELFISVITVHELELGVLLVERSDPAQAAVLRTWLDRSVAAAFDGKVLPVDERVARRAAALHVPDPAPFRDALIGATALAHDMTVVTRGLKDFLRFDQVDTLNPWT